MIKNYTFIILAVLMSFGLKAQDVHFTQFQLSPSTLNPALTGAFLGTFRVGGIYRDQALAITNDRYITPTFYVDMPLMRGVKENDWIGLGLGFYHDRAGVGDLTTNKSMAGLSYHLGLDKNNNNVLSVGIQMAYVQRRLANFSLIRFEDGILSGGSTNEDANLIDPDGKKYTDWTAGAIFTSYLNDISSLRAGFSMGHLNRQNQGLYTSSDRLQFLYVGFAQFDYDISDRITLKPALFYQRKGKNDELAVQGMTSLLFQEDKDIWLNAGLGFRYGDALEFLVGADIGSLRVGASFDLTVSGLRRANNSFGAFELGVGYIAKIYKKPKVDPIIFCPRF
jgi:type IX secretion system PorP/SprF family membrane protein